ncbi:MAG: DUF3592 domain-containing protein, partial [Ruminococcus sp.]|nr:DUF3592 domain-containing protein [Ruminococcus sp.]
MLNIINISGGIVILLGIILAVMGIRQCRKRISDEDGFISTEAEIVDMDSRISIVLINLIPIIAKEYRPIIHFFTADGREIQTSMPYAMKMSDECKELFQMYESHTAINIRYNPKKPIEIYYHSKKGFRIREVIYKFFVSAVLVMLG